MSGELKTNARQLSGARILAKLNALGAVAAAFTDSVFAIKGSSDGTKKLRFEVDGFTTATTRVATFPNADITVASINVAQTFSAAQTYSSTATYDTSSSGITLSKVTGTTITVASTAAASVTTAGGYTSTVATGTAPFTATSTTVCPNLNASLLLGSTWAAPGTIGSGTPNTGAFTTVAVSGLVSSTKTGAILDATGATTSYKSVHLQNTSGDAYFGVEGSVAGGTFTGSAAYDAVYYTPGRLYLAGFGGVKIGSGAVSLDTSSDLTISKTTGTTLVVSSTAATCATFGGGATFGGAITAGASTFTVTDAGTTNEPLAFTLGHNTSGTPASGFGLTFRINAQTSTTTDTAQAAFISEWVDATHATRTGQLSWFVYDSVTAREAMRFKATGAAAAIGFLGASATVRAAITGSRGGNAALASLLTELATKGLITDSTTA